MMTLMKIDTPVRVFRHPDYPRKMAVSVPRRHGDQQTWNVEKEQYMNLSGSGIFAKDPPNNNKFNGNSWVADIVSVDEQNAIGVIQNDPSPLVEQAIGTTIQNATVSVGAMDPMRQKQERALSRMKDCFAYEINGQYDSQKPWAVLEIPCSQALLHHRDTDAREWEEKPLPFYGWASEFEKKLEYALESSHGDFLDATAIARGGMAGAIGPPGSGKTTLLVKFVSMLYRQGALGKKHFAMCAHSNQAARALLEKALDYLPTMFKIPTSHFMLAESDKSRARRLDDGPMPPALEALTLHSRRRALAESLPWKYGLYLSYEGKPEDAENSKQWQTQRDAIDSELRGNVKIFIGTINAMSSRFLHFLAS
jgi:hypothetical protein